MLAWLMLAMLPHAALAQVVITAPPANGERQAYPPPPAGRQPINPVAPMPSYSDPRYRVVPAPGEAAVPPGAPGAPYPPAQYQPPPAPTPYSAPPGMYAPPPAYGAPPNVALPPGAPLPPPPGVAPALPTVEPAAPAVTSEAASKDMIVHLKVTDKNLGRSRTHKVPTGRVLQYKQLEVLPKRCVIDGGAKPRPLHAALLEIYEKKNALSPERLFSGWMLAGNASLSYLTHPYYDVTLVECEPKRRKESEDEQPEDEPEAAPAEATEP